ncbi:hypothetical protein M3J09_000844 [Ascochyta lentis]
MVCCRVLKRNVLRLEFNISDRAAMSDFTCRPR